MNKRIMVLLNLCFLFFVSGSFISPANKAHYPELIHALNDKPSNNFNTERNVLIYGFVYEDKCNTESAFANYTVTVLKSQEAKTEFALRKQLEVEYPKAKRIYVKSTSFSITSASHFCLLEAKKKTSSNCFYSVYFSGIGNSAEEAKTNAIKVKKNWSDPNADYTILKEISFNPVQ